MVLYFLCKCSLNITYKFFLVQSHYEAQMADRNETHQKELEKVVMKSKNELNALIIQHGKELELAKQELETVKSYADSQRNMEMMEKEAEWSSIKHEVGFIVIIEDLTNHFFLYLVGTKR